MRIELKKTEAYDDTHRSLESYSEKEKWSMLSKEQKKRYIFDYYKFHILGILAALCVIGYLLFSYVTHKETVLSVSLINMPGDMDASVLSNLTDGFLDYAGISRKKNEVNLFQDLYVSNDESDAQTQFGAVNQMKLSTYIGAAQMDIVFLDSIALEHFTGQDLLYDLDTLLKDSDLHEQLADSLINHTAVEITDNELLRFARVPGPVYLGVLINTERPDMSAQYIDYVAQYQKQ